MGANAGCKTAFKDTASELIAIGRGYRSIVCDRRKIVHGWIGVDMG
jgi:hypothetical protein